VIVESIHVLYALPVSRFLGAARSAAAGWLLPAVPVSKMVARLMPWTVAGFVVMVISGALLFLCDSASAPITAFLSHQGWCCSCSPV
jgi:hypothetical protein